MTSSFLPRKSPAVPSSTVLLRCSAVMVGEDSLPQWCGSAHLDQAAMGKMPHFLGASLCSSSFVGSPAKNWGCSSLPVEERCSRVV